MASPNPFYPDESDTPAHCMALHSRLAYSGHREVADQLKFHRFDKLYLFTYLGSNAYLAGFQKPEGKMCWILAFRGTENDYKDILHDITVFKRTADYDHGYRVHGGFLTAIQHVWGSWGRQQPDNPDDIYTRVGPKGISEILVREVRQQDTLWVTGHSLGGALAHLAAYYIQRDMKLSVTGLYTFGAPRLLDKDMAELLKTEKPFPAYRFVHAADIVPRVPPWVMGFHHGAPEWYISKKGDIYKKPGIFLKFKDIWYRQFFFILMVAAIVFGFFQYISGFNFWLWNALLGLAVGMLAWLMIPRLFKLIPFPLLRGLRFRAFSDHQINKYVEHTSNEKGFERVS